MVYCCGRELEENEEQGKNKKMKSIVVEEQEQEEGSEGESETGFVDLDPDTLRNVLERVDMVTLGRAACVNKLWRRVACDNHFWEPICIRSLASSGKLRYIGRSRLIGESRPVFDSQMFYRFSSRRLTSDIVKPPPDFYSIDFSKKIRPWVQKKRQNLFFIPHTEKVTHNRGL